MFTLGPIIAMEKIGLVEIHCNAVNQANCYFQYKLFRANTTSETTIYSFNMCLLTIAILGSKKEAKEIDILNRRKHCYIMTVTEILTYNYHYI